MIETIVENKVVVAQAPAKIIISGEHAVVYNQTAIACAIKKYTTVRIASNDVNSLIVQEQFYSFRTLRDMYLTAKSNYQLYLRGQISINRILKNPAHFLPVAIYEMLELLNYDYSQGLTVTVDSDIPAGVGMGSSSALLTACINALVRFLQSNLSLSAKYTYARNIENLQHGRSSGLDLYVSFSGGMLYRTGNIHKRLRLGVGKFYIVNTGQPQSTTGECVSFVKEKFKSQTLIDEFTQITNSIFLAIENNDAASLLTLIASNQKLLESIDVVSTKVRKFINELNTEQTSAKISGAGSVLGDESGMVLIYTLEENLNRILPIVVSYGYQIELMHIGEEYDFQDI